MLFLFNGGANKNCMAVVFSEWELLSEKVQPVFRSCTSFGQILATSVTSDFGDLHRKLAPRKCLYGTREVSPVRELVT